MITCNTAHENMRMHSSRSNVRKSMLYSFLFIFCVLFFIPHHLYAKTVRVEAKWVNIRSGAGNYYRVIYKAPKYTKLEVIGETGSWYKIQLPDDKTGYVSKKALQKRRKKDRFRRRYYAWKDERGVGKVAAPEIVAATKGLIELGPFAKRYAEKHDIDMKVLEQLQEIPFSPDEFETFKRGLSSRRRVRIAAFSSDGIQEIDRDIGTAIALRICSRGLSTNSELKKYISLVGYVAVEQTPLDDETFVFILIESPKVEAFAVPGGYIFITTGAVQLMKNEAELAGVLTHEIVHVVQRHGMKELEKQETRIKSQQLTTDLDEELEKLDMDRGDVELFEELDEMTDQLYEHIISGRKQESEDEADKLGTLLLYNSGYRADGLKTFLSSWNTISDEQKGRTRAYRPYEERAVMIDAVIKKNRLAKRGKKTFEERFQEMAK